MIRRDELTQADHDADAEARAVAAAADRDAYGFDPDTYDADVAQVYRDEAWADAVAEFTSEEEED